MSAADFLRALVRNWRTGVVVCLLCILGAAALSINAPQLYRATTVFQIAALAPLGSIPPGSGMLLHLDVTVLQDWLGREDVLEQALDLAGARGQVTVGVLHRRAIVLPAESDGTLGLDAADASSPAARNRALAIRQEAQQSVGVYAVSVWDTSPARAERLADALALVLGQHTEAAVRRSLEGARADIRKAAASAESLMGKRELVLARSPRSRNRDPHDLAEARYRAAVEVYTTLQEQLAGLDVMKAIGPGGARVLAKAGPPALPATPGRALYVLFGVMTGVVAGVTAALLHEGVRGAREEPHL